MLGSSSTTAQRNGVPTQVWFVQGKAANKKARATLHRENAILSEDNPPDPKAQDATQDNPQHNIPEEKGHDDGGTTGHVRGNTR